MLLRILFCLSFTEPMLRLIHQKIIPKIEKNNNLISIALFALFFYFKNDKTRVTAEHR